MAEVSRGEWILRKMFLALLGDGKYIATLTKYKKMKEKDGGEETCELLGVFFTHEAVWGAAMTAARDAFGTHAKLHVDMEHGVVREIEGPERCFWDEYELRVVWHIDETKLAALFFPPPSPVVSEPPSSPAPVPAAAPKKKRG